MIWKEIASEFVWDGTWRDIYVLGTTITDWQRVLDLLNDQTPNALTFYVDGGEPPSAPSAGLIFERREETSMLLQVTAGNVHLNCHFFCEEEIEFDLDPRELRGEQDLQAVLAFMGVLANGTGKPAILTHENAQEAVILTVQPGS